MKWKNARGTNITPVKAICHQKKAISLKLVVENLYPPKPHVAVMMQKYPQVKLSFLFSLLIKTKIAIKKFEMKTNIEDIANKFIDIFKYLR